MKDSSPLHERLITGTREANHRYSTSSSLIYHRSPTHRRLIIDTWQANHFYITDPRHRYINHRLITDTPPTHFGCTSHRHYHYIHILVEEYHRHITDLSRTHHRHITDTSQMHNRRSTYSEASQQRHTAGSWRKYQRLNTTQTHHRQQQGSQHYTPQPRHLYSSKVGPFIKETVS